MRALVTGATGFVGGHLVEALLARGDAVTALVRNPERAAGLAARGVTLTTGDVGAAPTLARAVADQDVVYHVAGLIAARSEAEFLATNRDGTARLVEAAAAAGRPRLVLVSSLAAGGPSPPDHPLDGTEPPRPVTRYGRSKLAGEAVVRGSDLPWTIIRPPAVYGPGDREMLRVFRATALGIAPVFGDGSQPLSVVFGPDLAAALVAAATAPATIGNVYYACHAERLTTRRLVELAGAAAGRRPVVLGIPPVVGRTLLWTTETAAALLGRATILTRDKAAELFAPAWLADPSRLTRDAGWTASHDFAAGARITVAWYRDRRWL